MQVAFFLRGVEVPDDVIRETDHAVAGDAGEFREAFGFDLVVDWFVGEVDACLGICQGWSLMDWMRDGMGMGGGGTFPVQLGSDEKTYAADAVEGDFEGGVVAPVAELGHVLAVGFELGVAFGFR